jgi:hypothetical protein
MEDKNTEKEKQSLENIKDIEDIFDTDWRNNKVNENAIKIVLESNIEGLDGFDRIVMASYEDYKTPQTNIKESNKDEPKKDTIRKPEIAKPKKEIKKEVIVKKKWDDEEDYYDEYDEYGNEYDYYMMK